VITQGIVTGLLSALTWVIGLIPSWEAPSWFTNLDETVNGAVDTLNGLGAWANWALITTCVAVNLAVIGVLAIIRAVLIAKTSIPAVGGGS
jgi:hypothetical protein